MVFRKIKKEDDAPLAEMIRVNLRSKKLDIPGTAYFDEGLDHLSEFYLKDPKSRYYLIAEEDGEVVGGVGLAELSFIEGCAELQKLYLLDKAKGKGIGYKLISSIEEKAKELGYKKMYLETHTNLGAAIHEYEKCGYKEINKPDEVVHSTMNKFYLKEF